MSHVSDISKDYIVSSLEEFFEDYSVITPEEFFKLLDKETQKRSQMVAKSLTHYLKKVKTTQKTTRLKKVNI